MTCNDQQVIWLRKMAMKNTQKNAAVGSNMSVRTARKYLSTHKLPSELRGNCKRSRSKKHMLLEVWPEIVELLALLHDHPPFLVNQNLGNAF